MKRAASDEVSTFDVIVIESSALRFGASIAGINGTLLAHYCEAVGASIRIPEVTLGECETLIREETAKQRETIAKALRRLQALHIGSFSLPPEEEMLATALEEFKAVQDSVGASPLPIPAGLGHDSVLTRLQAGKKPFKGVSGSRDVGYRDCLIWESILGVAHDGGELAVAFITANTADFGEAQEGETVLSEELRLEADKQGLTVKLFVGVDDFIRRIVKPSLPKSDQATILLTSNDWRNKLKTWLDAQLLEQIPGLEVAESMDWRGVQAENVTVSGVGELDDIEIHDVRELDGGQVVGEVEGRMEALLDFFVFRSDAFTLDDDDFSTLSSWNEHYYWGQAYEMVCFQLEIAMQITEQGLEFNSMTIAESEIEGTEF